MALFVLRKLILQTRARRLIVCRTRHILPYFMCANSEGSGETAGCTGSPKPSLAAYVMSTIISWAGSNCVCKVISAHIHHKHQIFSTPSTVRRVDPPHTHNPAQGDVVDPSHVNNHSSSWGMFKSNLTTITVRERLEFVNGRQPVLNSPAPVYFSICRTE